ncbi:MAG: PKD domain-containing protein [Bacteroidia bacterium]
MKRLRFLLLLLPLCFAWAHAQTYSVTVSGTVTDINGGAPIPNYPVDVVVDSNFFGFNYYNTVLTDANGDYQDVIAVPLGMNAGTGFTGVRDCTPAGYFSNNFTFSSNANNIPNLDFQICTGGGGGNCNAMFSSNWIQGTTLVQFTDMSSTSTGNINSYSWNFGDGGGSTQQNPSHAYNAMGTYVVCLTISTTLGCTSTYCDSVQVGGGGGGINCNAALSTTLNPNGSYSFTASGTGTGVPFSYNFDFGDGNSSSGSSATASHTYAANGTYIVCVDVMFSDSCSARACDTIVVGGMLQCQAGFYWYPDTTGQYSIIVVNTSTGNNLTYQWTFGDGSGSQQAYPQHTYNGPGTYVVCVTIASNNPQCTSTYCDSLVVVNKVATPFTINVIASGATANEPVQPLNAAVSLYPNPAHDHLQIDVTLEDAAPVSLQLMDLSGRAVQTENPGYLGSGKHGIRIDTRDLPAGLYLARVQAGGSISTHKVLIAH